MALAETLPEASGDILLLEVSAAMLSSPGHVPGFSRAGPFQVTALVAYLREFEKATG